MLSEYINSLPKEGKLSREEEARLWDAYKNCLLYTSDAADE